MEAIACVQAVREDIIPPTINTTEIEPGYRDDFNFVLRDPIRTTVHYAMSNTFGFGGHIATSIFKKYQ